MPVQAIQRFLKLQSASGILLMIAAAAALICANVPGIDRFYKALLDIPIEIRLGALELNKNFLLIVNDGLMAVFFLLVGLEIKREIMDGELSDRRQVTLPAIAAVGGVAIPALIYFFFTQEDPVGRSGWAIPAATDIAFSLGILSLLGSRVPLALKVFLTAVAVVDDLGAIIIIALFYTSKLSITALVLGVLGMVVLAILNRLRVTHLGMYMLVGVLIWVCVLKSGVHATLAGVALGFAIPLRAEDDEGHSPLRHLEHMLHPYVAYLILPLFAFVNSGVSFRGIGADVLFGPVTLGIAGGLLIGKTVGVFGFSALAVVTKVADLPTGTSWGSLFGVSILTGVGFTMSLFIGMLAFEGAQPDYAVATRLGVFGGSILAALIGLGVLRVSLPKEGAAGETEG
ncbi:MAG: Na+/H+ antiporter NhaA [Gemmatimonadetes bacterium]|nr:Na+/H+ antiporter NhaA [Gemmatimonadota bacterium]